MEKSKFLVLESVKFFRYDYETENRAYPVSVLEFDGEKMITFNDIRTVCGVNYGYFADNYDCVRIGNEEWLNLSQFLDYRPVDGERMGRFLKFLTAIENNENTRLRGEPVRWSFLVDD